jgi:hypothetical protein
VVITSQDVSKSSPFSKTSSRQCAFTKQIVRMSSKYPRS